MTNKRSGQVMLITVVMLSGAVLASTSLAGLLILYQLRQATNAKASMQAVFAADAGLEWAFYNENRSVAPEPYPHTSPPLSNGTVSSPIIYTVDKNDADPLPLKSIGQSGRTARAFQGSLPPPITP